MNHREDDNGLKVGAQERNVLRRIAVNGSPRWQDLLANRGIAAYQAAGALRRARARTMSLRAKSTGMMTKAKANTTKSWVTERP